MKLEQIYTKHVSIWVAHADVTASTSFYRPFEISVGRDEILSLHALYIVLTPGISDTVDRQFWALLQKTLTWGNDVEAIGGMLTDRRNHDNDILVRGCFTLQDSLAPVETRHIVNPVYLKFPEPFLVPRSPTLEFQADTGNGDLYAMATLFYRKHRVSDNEVRKLLKQYVGRKQDIVSNIPRVIDE